MKAVRHYLLDIPYVRRNHLLFFPLKIISVREIYSDSLFITSSEGITLLLDIHRYVDSGMNVTIELWASIIHIQGGGISFNTAGSISKSWMWKLSPGKLPFPRTWTNIEMDIF